MDFIQLLKPSSAQLPSNWTAPVKRPGGQLYVLKDQFTMSTFLAFGACLVGPLYFAIGRIAFVLPFILLFYRTLDACLMSIGVKHNPHMDGVITNKFSAQLPDETGHFGPKPASEQVCVFLIGGKCNHPLGLLAPGFKQLGDFFDRMHEEIEQNAEKYGLLGSTRWVESGSRDTNNEFLTLMYFKNADAVHQFAHEKLHREGWDWWNKWAKDPTHRYMSIWHELYVAPKGHWETIYANSQPTLLASARVPIKTEEGKQWYSTIVDARKGPLKSSKGRMTMTDGKDNDHIHDPYDAAYAEAK